MSWSSQRLERKSVEFKFHKNSDIDPTAPTMVTLNQDRINALVSYLQQAADVVAPPA